MADTSTPPRVRNYRVAAGILVLSVAALAFPADLRALWPAMMALGLIFVTRSAALSLLTACASALLLLAIHEGSGLQAWVHPVSGGLRATILGPWHFGALVFTLLLGAFSSVIERSGGLLPLLRVGREINERTRKRFLTSLFGLGLLCFFDGLANAIMLGRVARPIVDRLGISRALLAYLVDTTSSAVACLAFLSTWIVTQLSYIESHSPLDQPAYLQFLASIPSNFYCLFALFLALLVVRRNWLIGPMRASVPAERGNELPTEISPSGSLRCAAIPLLVLLVSLPVVILVLHSFSGDQASDWSVRIPRALNSKVVPYSFIIGSTLALLAALVCYPRTRRGEAPAAALQGARQLVPALLILLLAWVLGSLFDLLGTARVLSEALGDRLPLAFFPAGVFLLGCVISFISGTSWGTMGILMPIVLPTAGGMAELQGAPPEFLAQIVPGVIGAVFGGAVFGDHCSPYSDTTIVSALASGVSTPEHTITQLPYALIAAGMALAAGYLPTALGLSPWLALALGGGVLVALVWFVHPARR